MGHNEEQRTGDTGCLKGVKSDGAELKFLCWSLSMKQYSFDLSFS